MDQAHQKQGNKQQVNQNIQLISNQLRNNQQVNNQQQVNHLNANLHQTGHQPEEELLSIQYLLENPSLLQAPETLQADKSKEEKLAEPSGNDLPSAYLGPQIWNDMLLSDDLKLEPVDLDELFDANITSEVDSDLGMFMASETSPSSATDNTTKSKPIRSLSEPQATGQQQQNYQQRHLSQQYGPVYEKMSPNINQQAPSPSDYLAAKQQQQQKPQLNRVSQHSSPDQNMQQNLHRQISNGQEVNQRRLSSTGQIIPQQANQQMMQQQYPVFRSPYQQQQQQQQQNNQVQRSPQNNFLFDYTTPSPSSDYRRKSTPNSPSGSLNGSMKSSYGNSPNRKRSHDSQASDGSPVNKFKVPSPQYGANGEPLTTTIRIPSPTKVNFVVNDADVMISTPRKNSGEEETYFDPSTRAFSQEELKPQPIIRKSRKTFVPPDDKDVKYWNRRRKNNVAAKRSREARRIKENQIALRASYLEQENVSLKTEIQDLRNELERAVHLLRGYERAFPNFASSSFVSNVHLSPQQMNGYSPISNVSGNSPPAEQGANQGRNEN